MCIINTCTHTLTSCTCTNVVAIVTVMYTRGHNVLCDVVTIVICIINAHTLTSCTCTNVVAMVTVM